MDTLIHQLGAGIGNGAIYASLALAIVFIYRSSGVLNFAQGEMAMFSTFIAWQLIQWGVPIVLAMLITVAVSMVIGIVTERLVIRPLYDKPHLATIIVTVGLLIFFNALAGAIWTFFTKTFPSPFPKGALSIGPISSHTVGVFLTIIVTVVILGLLLQKTKLGLAMRASAISQQGSRLVGIRVGWILALGWGVAAAIGAISGMLIAPQVMLEPNMMNTVLVYAFASAVLGGIDSLSGAVVGGIIVGVTEALAATYVPAIGADLKILVPLVIIPVVLLLRPQGLFGNKEAVRV